MGTQKFFSCYIFIECINTAPIFQIDVLEPGFFKFGIFLSSFIYYVFSKTYLIVEEVYGVFVEPEGEGLEEGDVVGHHLLVREVKLVHNDGVHMVVGEKVIWKMKERPKKEVQHQPDTHVHAI